MFDHLANRAQRTTCATIVSASVAATITALLGFAGLGWTFMSVEDLLIVPLVFGPYGVLVALNWWQRQNFRRSMIIVVVAALVSAFGVCSFGWALHRKQTAEHMQLAMDLSPLVVPVYQWLVVLGLSLLITGITFYANRCVVNITDTNAAINDDAT